MMTLQETPDRRALLDDLRNGVERYSLGTEAAACLLKCKWGQGMSLALIDDNYRDHEAECTEPLTSVDQCFDLAERINFPIEDLLRLVPTYLPDVTKGLPKPVRTRTVAPKAMVYIMLLDPEGVLP